MKLYEICEKNLQNKGLDKNELYVKRLKWEMEEIHGKEKEGYFLNLYENKIKYPVNQNNLLCCWLLGIVPDFDILNPPACDFGDSADIDVDYTSACRAFLKDEWALKFFGEDYVCNISNYMTFGIKSSLIDMARVFGKSRDEVLSVTKNIDLKDDEGKTMTWDAAMRLCPELKKYCEENPDVADAAKKLLNRNRGMGQHAGGLIISSVPLSDFVPLVKRKDNPQASAWVEGLHGQDLQPMGLVKFDLLVINNLMQISNCCELVKKRHNIESICALPGGPDWSDTLKWRNDPKGLELAAKGDLKCIFQFDSAGIRKLATDMNITRFEDIVAATALYRPGCLMTKMHERYIERKKGNEEYKIHPIIDSILADTYNVMVYQEQIMKILNAVGDISFKDCYAVIKAVSKKKIEGFKKYKDQFIKNGQNKLGFTEEKVAELWGQLEAFSEYGFNLSHSVSYSYISSRLLYLKAHYPHEFYTAILRSETLSDKIKEYKIEAKNHNIEMERVDINKSKENFDLIDDKIYFGFSKIKGIGEEPAKRIVAGQPYKSFEDFLRKFGTDSNTLKRLIGLRCFKDANPITLWKFTEYYKECLKKVDDKKKRFEKSMEKFNEKFAVLCPNEKRTMADLSGENPFDDPEWACYDKPIEFIVPREVEMAGGTPKQVLETIEVEGLFMEKEVTKYYQTIKIIKSRNILNELKKLWNLRKNALKRAESFDDVELPKLVDFNPETWPIEDSVLESLRSIVKCEEEYYGFAWIHDLEKSPDHKPNMTFEDLRQLDTVGPVEVKIMKKNMVKSKKGTTYYQFTAEDICGESNKINIWQDDLARWDQELQVNNLLRLRLNPPSGGFSTYTLESNRKSSKTPWILKYPTKDVDYRVWQMRPPIIEEEKYLTLEEVLAQYD